MTTGSILLGIALAILVGLFLARPLLKASQEEQGRLTRRQVLLAEKEAILAQIRDLDFDHDTGKMPDEIHQHQRTQLMSRAAEILRQLEILDGKAPPSEAGPEDVDIDAEIEAAITRIRQAQARGRGSQAVRTRPANGGFCPQCGQPFDAGDKFCVACGHKLQTKQVLP